MKNTKTSALRKLTEEEMAIVAGAMSCDKAISMAMYYNALSSVQSAMGDQAGALASQSRSLGLFQGGCSP